jgi:hypothetical protein
LNETQKFLTLVVSIEQVAHALLPGVICIMRVLISIIVMMACKVWVGVMMALVSRVGIQSSIAYVRVMATSSKRASVRY